ncbi:MAG: hypothetical protein AAF196_06795 [Planctomycetota bacterium]
MATGCSNQLYRPQLWTLESELPDSVPVDPEGPSPIDDPILEPAPPADPRIALQVDGRATRPIELRPIPYYGDIELLAAVRDTELALDLRTDRQLFSIQEPASPWLFPLDFLVEVTMGGLGLLPPQRTSIGPAERESVFLLEDEELEALSRRAEHARARRSVYEPIHPAFGTENASDETDR